MSRTEAQSAGALPDIINLLRNLPAEHGQEHFSTLLQGQHYRLERIVSHGHTTPPGEWYDQDWDEWVMLLSGAAHLAFADAPQPYALNPGDALLIPAHCRHRVTWTDPHQPSVWLALHVDNHTVAA